MRNESHTLIGTLRDLVTEWRKREGWSRETVGHQIVTAHEAHGMDALTEIRFETSTGDAFQRMKNNADRIFRWLDDETKDSTLLPANFVDSILLALPDDLRICFFERRMERYGLGPRSLDEPEASPVSLADLCEQVSVDAESTHALAQAVKDPSPENIERAYRLAAKAADKKSRIVRLLAGARRAFTGAKTVLRKFRSRESA